MNMREKVAKAIYEQRNGAGAVPWSRRDNAHKGPYLDDADVVLDVLMEPTDGMLEAGYIAASDYEDRNPHEGFSIPDSDPISMFVFRAMIEAAKEGK